jgi:predicted MFS family arabinose efflux permease
VLDALDERRDRALLALAATAQPALSIALVVAAGVAGMGRPPLFSGALNARIPSEQRATVLSAVSAARTLAIGILYPAVGVLVDRSLVAALACVGALGLLAALLAAAPVRLFADAPATD